MLDLLKNIAKVALPTKPRLFIKEIFSKTLPSNQEYRRLTNKQVFEKIYRDKAWGDSPIEGRNYFSGSGSYAPTIVNGYVEAVKNFLYKLGEPKTLVDLGCGDFNIGSKIAPFSSTYIACDIVENVIQENKEKFHISNVDFCVLDMINEELPYGDVFLVRQVLQHITNADILKFVQKVSQHCRYLIVTEHIPSGSDFLPNIDFPNGPCIRLSHNSGIDLSKKPFCIDAKSEHILCEFEEYGGLVRTTVYSF